MSKTRRAALGSPYSAWRRQVHWDQRFSSALLAICIGFLIALVGVDLAVSYWGQTEKHQWLLFELGVIAVPGFAICLTQVIKPERRTRFAFLEAIVLFIAVALLRFSRNADYLVVALLAVFQGFCIYRVLRGKPRSTKSQNAWTAILVLLALGLLECTATSALPLKRETYGVLPPIVPHLGAFVLGLVATGVYTFSPSIRFTARTEWILGLALFGVLLACTIEIPFNIELQHQNFFLAPVNDVLHGKSLLVDTASQYGVGVIYFLALLFALFSLPASYAGLTAITTALLVAEYMLIYSLLRKALRSVLCCWLAIAVVIMCNHYSAYGAVAYFPAGGPLRFGLPYGILFFLVGNRPIAALCILGLASIWSVETFIYSLAATVGWQGYQILGRATSVRDAVHGAKRFAMATVVAVSLAHALLCLITFFRSGHLPNWGYYLPFLVAYSPLGGVGIEVGFRWGEWILVLATYLASFLGCSFSITLPQSKPILRRLSLLSALTLLGLAQFTYYLGQTHPSYLTRCAIPMILLVFGWLDTLATAEKRTGRNFHLALSATVFCGLFLCAYQVGFRFRETRSFVANTIRSFSGSATRPAFPHELWVTPACILCPCPTDARAARLAALAKKYFPGPRAALFLSTQNETTQTLLLIGKTHEWPIGEIRQDLIVPIGEQRILDYQPRLVSGDAFLLDENIWSASLKADRQDLAVQRFETYNPEQVLRVQAILVRSLCQKFDCRTVEQSDGLRAVRLGDR